MRVGEEVFWQHFKCSTTKLGHYRQVPGIGIGIGDWLWSGFYQDLWIHFVTAKIQTCESWVRNLNSTYVLCQSEW